MHVQRSRALTVVALALLHSGCSEEGDHSLETASECIVTLDTHIDIPLDFATAAIDPATADLQVNLGKMAAGGLDAGFFIVFVGQTARTEDGYTFRDWVDAPGVRYEPVDGEHELLPGLRLVPAPGHSRGMQVVVVETGGRPHVVGGDVGVWFGELDEPTTEGQLRVRALDPELVWLAHEHEPWRPRTA